MRKATKPDAPKVIIVTPTPLETPTRYLTARQWAETHPWPSYGGIRNIINKKDENGFNSCIVRIGRRLLLDEAAVMAWIAAHRTTAEATR